MYISYIASSILLVLQCLFSVNDTFHTTVCTIGMALYFFCVTAGYLFTPALNKKHALPLLHWASYWHCVVCSDGDTFWYTSFSFCVDWYSILWVYKCLLSWIHFIWLWLMVLHGYSGMTPLPRHSDIAEGSPMIMVVFPVVLSGSFVYFLCGCLLGS